jgi:rare lipoprotein A
MRSGDYPRHRMDGNKIFKASLAAITLAAFSGSIAPALAESTIETPASTLIAPAVPADLPRFVPSTDALVTLDAGTLTDAVAAPEAEPAARALGDGVASWYGAAFAGRKTASGERFDPDGYTAAHRTLPFGSKVRVSRGGKSVIVRINDRGPFHGNRLIDLSEAAADELGLVRAGSGRVELALLQG